MDEAEKIRQQVTERAKVTGASAGGGTLFTEPVLVVNQKAKLIELVAEYSVYDGQGKQLAKVREVGQSAAKKVLRAVSRLDTFMSHRYEVVDPAGATLLVVQKGRSFLKSTVTVSDGSGAEVGRIVQENALGKIRFALQVGEQKIGSLNAENWRAWNFTIQDASGNEVARITKTWEGLAKAMFTTADNYVLQITAPLDEPLRSLVVASALTVDTALKQANG